MSKYSSFYPEAFHNIASKLFNQKGLILDAGCGTGVMAYRNKGKGFKFVGIDISKEAINKCRTRPEYKKCFVWDLEKKLPFKTNQFNQSICMQTFYYVKNWKQLLKELMRVTSEKVIITFPNYNYAFLKRPELWLKRKSAYSHFSTLKYKELEEEIKKKGFAFKKTHLNLNYNLLRGWWFCNEFIYEVFKK